MYADVNPGDYRNYVSAAQSPAQVASLSSGAAAPEKAFSLWDSDGFSFGDIVDIINPLQHIPVVSTIYREMTGDDIGPGPGSWAARSSAARSARSSRWSTS